MNKGVEKKDPPAAGSGERRDRKLMADAPGERRSRKPAVFGVVVAVGAVGAWLLRRERPRAPEGTWRDLLSTNVSQNRAGDR